MSLDAALPAAVRAGRELLSLPYYDATIELRRGRAGLSYSSARAGEADASFELTVAVEGDAVQPAPESFAIWMAERYAFFTTRRGRLLRGDVEHVPWQIRAARIERLSDGLVRASGLPPGGEPVAHASSGVNVVARPLSAAMVH